MSEIDPLILEMKANLNSYQAGIRTATRTVESQLGKQERSAQRLEKQMLRSSTSISTAFRGIAGTLATAFTGRELVGLIDSFTRLQNNLKVAGLEGEALAGVQQRLLDLSGKYGVSVENLSSVFLKASLAQQELGASTDQIIQLNEITAASLKITGTSAQEASGALLQLGQALGSGVVRAEEFNSILEGALPLAQAAARGIDGFGGSVSKLRGAIADGEITSKQFFDGVLKGGIDTIKQAEGATKTLSAAFESLTSQLTVYVGEAAKTSGTTQAMALAIEKLADNLDTVIPIIAVLAGALGANAVTSLVAARIAALALAGQATGTAASMGILSSASFALQARMAGAATSMEAATFAARGLGAALVIPAIGALVVGLAYIISNLETLEERLDRASKSADDLEKEAGQMEDRLRKAGVAIDDVGDAANSAVSGVDRLSRSFEQARKKAKELEDQAGITALKLAELDIKRIQSEKASIRSAQRGRANSINNQTRAGDAFATTNEPGRRAQESQLLLELDRQEKAQRKRLQALALGIRNGVDVTKVSDTGGGSGVPTKDKKTKTPKGPKEPKDRTDEIRSRFNDELASITQQTLSAEQQLATSADDRAELELRSIELARLNTIEGIKAEKDYNNAQGEIYKQRLIQQVEALTEFEREGVERARQAQLAREAADIARQTAQNEIDGLRDQLDLAKTQKDRRDIALRIVDAFYDSELAALESAKLAKDLNENDRKLLQLKIDRLKVAKGAERQSTLEDTAGPLEDYINRIPKGPVAIGEEIERDAVSAIRDLNSGLADAIVNGENLGDVLENTGKRFIAQLIEMGIQLLFIKPLLESLGGSSGGGLFSTLGSIFASAAPRAAGGPVSAGEVYRINESGQEYFKPNTDGKMIAANQVNAMKGGQGAGQSQQGGVVEIRLKDDMLDARIVSGSVEVVKIAAPQITNAAVSETFRRSSRPRI
tara:strand:- start:1403 stop:4261 length:2859 start_codon:yes stop_codon:yes gene_type:complete